MGCSTSMQRPPTQTEPEKPQEKPATSVADGVAVTQPQSVGDVQGDAAVQQEVQQQHDDAQVNQKNENRRQSRGAWNVNDNEEEPEKPPQNVTLSTVAEETPIAVMSPGTKSPTAHLEDSHSMNVPEEQALLLQSAAASDIRGFNDSTVQPSPRNADAP